MLPKKKNKHPLPDGEVNVTSLMDIMTTLLFFILMVLSFNKVTIIDAFAPQSGAVSDDKKKVFTLKVTYPEKGKVEIVLGPLDELKIVDESGLISFLNGKYKGTKSTGYRKTISSKDPEKLKHEVREALKGIKKGFPHEHQVTLALSDKVVYQDMIYMMEALKTLPENEALDVKNLIGKHERTNVLFPQVVLVEI